MPRLVEMGTLLTRAQARADKESDDHIGDSVWRAFMSEVYGADVYSVVAATGLRYFEYLATLTTTGAAYVSEPSGHLATIRLDYVDSSGKRRELDELMCQEEAFFSRSGSGSGPARFYTLIDDRIYLYPTPPSGQTYELLYVPQPPDLSGFADDACVDVVTPDGEACLVWGVAALAKVKAGQDASFHASKAERHKVELQFWAANRSLSQPRRRVVQMAELAGRPFDPAEWR